MKEGRANQLPKNNSAQVSKHAMKQRAADAGTAAKTRSKVKQNIPAPAPKRGR